MRDLYPNGSRVAFADSSDGGSRVPFRSHLEAKWAIVFNASGLEWEYEPQAFSLPAYPSLTPGSPGRHHASIYTPDFRVQTEHGPAWIEVKPNGETLRAAGSKLDAFARVLPDGERVFSLSTCAPQWIGMTHWRGGTVRTLRPDEMLRTLSGPTGRAWMDEDPEGYWAIMNQYARGAGRKLHNRINPVGEVAFALLVEHGHDFNALAAALAEGIPMPEEQPAPDAA